jgi:outer membrane lipoprotein SlyB
MKRGIAAALALSVMGLGLGGCQTSTGTGALVGTAVGAGLGAAVGGHKGAFIGGALGLIAGTAIGHEIDRQRQDAARTAWRENRVVVREVTDDGETYRVRATPPPAGETRVTTTVSKRNPQSGQWEVISTSTQNVN